MAVPRIRLQTHCIAAASIPQGARPCIHHPGTRPAVHQWLFEYARWRSMSTSSTRPPTCRRPSVLLEAQSKKINHIPGNAQSRHASTSTSAWHISTTQHPRQVSKKLSTSSEPLEKNLGASSTLVSQPQDPSTNYWKMYQEKVNKKERITHQELIRLSRWLGAQPMNKDTAQKLTKLIRSFQKAKLPFDMTLYNDLIHFHIKRNKFDEVQWVLDTMIADRSQGSLNSKVSQRTLALIMAMHLKTGNAAGLDRLIQRQDNGIAHYMAKFLEWTRGLQLTNEHIQTAKRIFFDLQFKRCEPNTPRFTHLLEHLFNTGKAQEALGLVNHILDIGYSLNKFTSTSVMSGLLRAKLLDDATAVWGRIQGNDISDISDISIANSLLAMFSQDPKRLGAAQVLWARMNEATSGLKPDEHSFGSMMASYLGAKEPAAAVALWHSMQKAPHWIKPSRVLYNVMINGLFYTHQPETAKTLYEELLARKDLKEPLALDTCHIMIRGLLSVRDVDGLQQVLARMEQDKVEPNGITYTIITNVLFSQRDAASADKISALMAGRDLPKTAITYSAMIAGYAQNGNMARAQELLEEMQGANHRPSIHVYGALMQGAFRSGQVALAEEMAQQAKSTSGGMSQGAYSIMIGGYSNLVMLGKAERWYDEMRRTLSKVTWEPHYVLLRACVEHKQWETAQRVVKAMKEHPFESYVPKLNMLIEEVERVTGQESRK
ncbi:MAG: hypothetical protein BYD32DRAFT_431017 [Podila humilis]|nr:MAG: hypothetical protein BYD32DRAFT_431017 [Podila humilis]